MAIEHSSGPRLNNLENRVTGSDTNADYKVELFGAYKKLDNMYDVSSLEEK